MYTCYFCNKSVSLADTRCPHCHSLLLLENRYRLISTLGQGGFGVVYEALDRQHNQRRCAIKRIEVKTLSEKQQIENEANILKQHAPHFRFVPDLYDFWSNPTHTYLVMECIDGSTLDQTPMPWKPAEVEHFLRTLLKHLTSLHAANTIHRDLKPWNITLTPQGRYVLLDFGIAKHESGTITGARGMGTINYAPPEQVQGLPTDQRSDLYSLAATAYWLLTEKSPNQARMDAGGTTPHPSQLVAGVPPHLDIAIMRMLEQAPEDRPQHAKAALELLDGNVLPTIQLPIGATVGQGVSAQRSPSASGMPIPAGYAGGQQAVVANPFTPLPPMPSSPSAQTRSLSGNPSTAATSAVATPPTQRLAWRVFMLVALLIIPLVFAASVGIWWMVSSGNTANQTVHNPTQMAGGAVLLASPSPSPTESTPTATHTPIPTPDQPSTQATTQASPPTNTPVPEGNGGDNQQAELAHYWQTYDQAIGQNDWLAAIPPLEQIINIAGPIPAAADYPSPPYDARMGEVAMLLAEARLNAGYDLQQDGLLDEAAAQYAMVLQSPGVSATLREQATAAAQRLEEARVLWQTVNTAWDDRYWESAQAALLELQGLDGFGDHALDPADRMFTVAQLLSMVERFLANEQPAPTDTPVQPTATSTPQVVPSDTATPTITPTPQPTFSPTIPVVEATFIPVPITPIILPTLSKSPQTTTTPILHPTPQPTSSSDTMLPSATKRAADPPIVPSSPSPEPTNPPLPTSTPLPTDTPLPTATPTDTAVPYPRPEI